MTKVEYNGGADVYVGLSTEPFPTAENDGVAEGALVICRDTKAVQVFSGDDTEGWSELVSFA